MFLVQFLMGKIFYFIELVQKVDHCPVKCVSLSAINRKYSWLWTHSARTHCSGSGPWPDIWYLIDIVHISSEASIRLHELRIETQRPDIMQFFGSRKEPNKSLCGISVCVSVFNPELKLSLALSLYLSRHAMTVSWLGHGCVMNVSWICHECVLRKVFWTPKHSLCALEDDGGSDLS